MAQRAKFYNDPNIAKIITKNGVPKTKKAMEIMVSEGEAVKSGSPMTQELLDIMGNVAFAVHPQQINIRDKANGKIIAIISR